MTRTHDETASPATAWRGARSHMTPNIEHLIRAEVANEAHGGTSPATFGSLIDSVWQNPDYMLDTWDQDDHVALLQMIALVGVDAEIFNFLLPKES